MAELYVYNTQTRKKEKFEPLEPPRIKMYCCGPTVYDLLHVGNFRGPVFYNFLRNWLEYLGYQVKMVYNYTDVDDRIIQRAQKEGVPSSEIAERYIKEFQQDIARLKLRAHDVNPKVTESMTEIKDMVGELIEKKKAYVARGDVLYSIQAFSGYGKLSNRNPDELMAGVRVERDEAKKNPLDFTLWKSAKPGEPAWESPWGSGRPGWHIECSAMIRKHLGDQIDIHGGGLDLVFPHHENEIAQSEGCTGKPFVKYWIHNNMINMGGAKMSKSLGNIMTARAFMDAHHPEIYKYMILSVHYRSVSDLTEETLAHGVRGLARIYSALTVADSYLSPEDKIFLADGSKLRAVLQGRETSWDSQMEAKNLDEVRALWKTIGDSLNDDFNTSEALAAIFEGVRKFNTMMKRGLKRDATTRGRALALTTLVRGYGSLGSLFMEEPRQFLLQLDDILLKSLGVERSKVDLLVEERASARRNKDFKKSDEIREQLSKMGISVSDTPEGSFWEVTK